MEQGLQENKSGEDLSIFGKGIQLYKNILIYFESVILTKFS